MFRRLAVSALAVSMGFPLAVLAEGAPTEGQVQSEALVADPTQQEISDAERLLWLTDQLGSIKSPMTLRYEFHRVSQLDDGFDDTVELEIVDVKPDGMKSARVEFFTGDRNQDVPPNENTNGNPLLAVYLQGDVYEMDRLTDGNWRYFHRKIKKALAESAEIADTEVEFEGERVPAKVVRIAPYVYDEKRDQFDEYADKTYEFIVSDGIPGYLYQIKTSIPGKPGPGGAAEPLVEETLKLVGAEP